MILKANIIKEKKIEEIKKRVQKNTKVLILSVGEDSASKIYVKSKEKLCLELNIECEVMHLDENITQEELLNLIAKANHDITVHGLLVQLPLPKHINEDLVIQEIDYKKDIDGFCKENIANLFLDDQKVLLPCTVKGIIDIIEYYNIDIVGKNVVIVGRSNIVGKPLALKLINMSATVISCNSRTNNIKELIEKADIFISAIGIAKYFDASYFENVRDNLVVIDVGINRDENNKLCGDVDTVNVESLVHGITPVPGGVGVMTVVNVVENSIIARELLENE